LKLKPLAAYLLREALLVKINDIDSAEWHGYERLVGRMLACNRNIVYPLDHSGTGQQIRDLLDDDAKSSTLVVTATGFPCLDFATSKFKWYNAKGGVSTSLSIETNAMVNLLVNILNFAEFDQKGGLRACQPLAGKKIVLSLVTKKTKKTPKQKPLFGGKLAEENNLQPKKVHDFLAKYVELEYLNCAELMDIEFEAVKTAIQEIEDSNNVKFELLDKKKKNSRRT
jgi:hypothetical protein